MTITFGSYTFEERGHIDAWEPPYRAAVYAILMPDATASPRPFREIYFGESENLSQRGFPNHHAWPCWLHQAGNDRRRLYVGVHLIPNSTAGQRRLVERELVTKYGPACNL